MSSLAATQADGYYVPSEYYDSGQYKKKSKNQYVKSKGHNQYEQNNVVRFELPYDGFCLNTQCQTPIGKGTRYNATKVKNGNYHSTTIWEFHMKCRICQTQKFIIRTNPKEFSFDYISGIHKQVKEFDTNDAGTLGVIDTDNNNKIIDNNNSGSNTSTRSSGDSNNNEALLKLEKRATGKRKAVTEHDQLQALIKINNATLYDDAKSNSTIRKSFRLDRNAKKKRLQLGKQLGWSEGMELLDYCHNNDEEEEERKKRRKVVTTTMKTYGKTSRDKEKDSFYKLRTSSIFSSSSSSLKRSNKSQRRKHTGSSSNGTHSNKTSKRISSSSSRIIPTNCNDQTTATITTELKLEQDSGDSSNNNHNTSDRIVQQQQQHRPVIKIAGNLHTSKVKNEENNENKTTISTSSSCSLRRQQQCCNNTSSSSSNVMNDKHSSGTNSRNEATATVVVATGHIRNQRQAQRNNHPVDTSTSFPLASSLDALTCCYESSSDTEEE